RSVARGCRPLICSASLQRGAHLRPTHPELQPGASGEVSCRRDRTDAGIDEIFSSRACGDDLREFARITCLSDSDNRSQQFFGKEYSEAVVRNHRSGARTLRREFTGLVKEVDQREIFIGNASPSRRQAFGGRFSYLLKIARRLPAARPIISVDL